MPRNQSEHLPRLSAKQMTYLRAWVTAHPTEPTPTVGGAYGTGGNAGSFVSLSYKEQLAICDLSWSERKAIVHGQKSK